MRRRVIDSAIGGAGVVVALAVYAIMAERRINARLDRMRRVVADTWAP